MSRCSQARSPDLTEENLQSRIRGSLLMALSNKFGSLVLTTGNKSEMAVGYCTLYGDMVGALAVIGDLVKTRVYAICRWLNREREIIPLPILEKPPSAELRPDQKDTDSCRPTRYSILSSRPTSSVMRPPNALRRKTVFLSSSSNRWYAWWSARNINASRLHRF